MLFRSSSEEGTTVNYNNLVPAEISNETDIKNAIDNKCIGTSGYVGCHVYKIEAGSSEALTSASIRLADLQTTATDYASWKFYLYKLDESGNVIRFFFMMFLVFFKWLIVSVCRARWHEVSMRDKGFASFLRPFLS